MDRTPTQSIVPPKLRRDLVLSPQGSGDATVLVVKDPGTGKFYRFRQIEAFLLEKLDGVNPLATLPAEVERVFGVTVSPATLQQFVEKLDRLGLLAKEDARPVVYAAPKRERGSMLYFRVASIDPDRFLTRLNGWLGFCFTPVFVFLAGLVILAAAGVTASNWSEITGDLVGLWNVQSLLVAWVVVCVTITLHEFAHGLTCKHFGGNVHELGFLLLYFQPAFYCNVSDAWLLPQKSRRLWVSFAGAYCDLIVWAVATFVWRVTETATGINQIALVIMGTNVIRTLFNLNPLIKLDGYYMLSDYLGIPNLRDKAVGFLKRQVKDVTGRERRIYLIYGLLAWTYSTWLLWFVALWFGALLTGQYQAWGFFAFIGLLAVIFRREFAKVAAVKFRKALIMSGVLAVAGVVLFLVRMELRVAGEFKIVPVQSTDLRAEVEGIIEEIRFEEGDRVTKGDVVARVSERDNRAELRKITAQIDERQAQLKMLRAGPRAEEIALAKTTVQKGVERVRFAKEKYQTYKTLYDEKLASRKEFQETEEEMTVRQKELEEVEGKLNVLLAGSRPEEIEAIEAELTRLDVQRRFVEDQLARSRLVSPIDGIVTTTKLKEKLGQHVNKGDLVATVHELRIVIAEIAVPEKEISEISVGQTVSLKARAFPQQQFQGTVAAIAPTVTKSKDDSRQLDRTLIVTTRLENPALLLKSEMTGTAKIDCGERRLLDLVTRRLARYIRVEFWSWW